MKKLFEVLKRSEGDAGEIFAQAKHISDFAGMFARLLFMSIMAIFCSIRSETTDNLLEWASLRGAQALFVFLSIHLVVLIGRYVVNQIMELLIDTEWIARKGKVTKILVPVVVLILAMPVYFSSYYASIAIIEFAKSRINATQ